MGTIVSVAVAMTVTTRTLAAEATSFVDIPALPLADALNQLARQSNRPLLFPYNDVKLLKTQNVSGHLTFEAALEQLLKNTGLQAHTTKDGVTTIIVETRPNQMEQEETMRKLSIKSALINGASAAIIAGTATVQAAAQTPDEPAVQSDEIIVLGSRSATPRTALETAVPVDSISAKDLTAQGDTDIINTLISVVPSLNASREPISDAATLIRPVNLRALPSDHTLVLVNGKRRHRGAVVGEFVSGVNRGAQGVDVSPLFGTSLKNVQILRDGASAQYGSDAIAGVINYTLNDDPNARKFSAQFSSTYDGDGDTIEAAGVYGFNLGDGGFLTLAAQIKDQEATSRGVQDGEQLDGSFAAGSAGALGEAGFPVEDPVVVWGQPDVSDDYKFALNAALPTDNGEVYTFGTYATRVVDGSFFYRNPASNTVFADGDNVRFADSTGDGCPVGALPTESFEEAQAFIDSAPDNCFAFFSQFPGGFTPRFGGTVEDIAITLGFRGETEAGFGYDFSAGLGSNSLDYVITNTVNASLGADTPTSFDLGSQEQTELVANADFVYRKDVGLASDLNIAFGAQYWTEEFEIGAGQPESFEVGPFASQGFAVGANGFAGFGDDVAGTFDRDSLSLYADLEADVTDRVLLTGAVRYEDFSDFGDTFNVKLSGLFRATDNINLRGSFSTGFRAPTLGQSNLQRLSTGFDATSGLLTEQLTIASTDPVAEFFGGGQLEPEDATNFSIGATADFGDLNITVDYFDISVDDRIAQTNANITDADRDILIAAGSLDPNSTVSEVNFFINDFDTNTRGVDVVANYEFESSYGATDLTLAANYTDTSVSNQGVTVSEGREREIEENLPDFRATFTATHDVGAFDGLVRVNYYSSITDSLFFDFDSPITGNALAIVDAEVGYTLSDNFRIAVGAKNLFDTFPEEFELESGATGRDAGFLGLIYPANHPAGFNGGGYYFRVTSDF